MKNLTLNVLVLLFFCLMNFACSTMPKERPQDFNLSLSDHGGMLPAGYSIEISGDSSCLSYHAFGAKNKVYFKLTEQELDDVYQQCVRQKFDIIKEKEEKVYDRGGISIRLNVNGKTIRKSDAGTSFIKGKYAERFGSVEGMIRKMVKEKTDALKQIVMIHIEDRLLIDSTFLYINVNNGGFTNYYFDTEKDSMKLPIEVPFYLGENHVSVNWMADAEKKYLRKNIASNQFTVSIVDTTTRLFLSKEEESIVLKSLLLR